MYMNIVINYKSNYYIWNPVMIPLYIAIHHSTINKNCNDRKRIYSGINPYKCQQEIKYPILERVFLM